MLLGRERVQSAARPENRQAATLRSVAGTVLAAEVHAEEWQGGTNFCSKSGQNFVEATIASIKTFADLEKEEKEKAERRKKKE